MAREKDDRIVAQKPTRSHLSSIVSTYVFSLLIFYTGCNECDQVAGVDRVMDEWYKFHKHIGASIEFRTDGNNKM